MAEIGLLFAGGLPIKEQLALAAEAEKAGLDSLWTGEFWRTSTVPLAALACSTERVKLGTCLTLAFPRSPFLTALSALDLDELSGHRFILGLGSGTRRIIEDWHGAAYMPPGARLRDYVDVVRQLWEHWRERPGHDFCYEGEYYKVRFQGHRRPAPVQSENVPIYLGGVNPGMIRTAGAIADGFLGHVLHSPSFISRVVRPALDQGVQEAGRRPGDVKLCALVIAAVDRDRNRAYRTASLGLSLYSFTKGYERVVEFLQLKRDKTAVRAAYLDGNAEDMGKAMQPELVEEVTIFGTPDDLRERLKIYNGLVDCVILYPPVHGLNDEEIAANYRAIIGALRG